MREGYDARAWLAVFPDLDAELAGEKREQQEGGNVSDDGWSGVLNGEEVFGSTSKCSVVVRVCFGWNDATPVHSSMVARESRCWRGNSRATGCEICWDELTDLL